jgi:glucose uptake protein
LYQPESYAITLTLMILSMLCWGSWANTVKLCPGYRFQLLYWDFIIGLIGGAILWGSTLGSLGAVGRSLYADIAHSGTHPILFAMAGGAIFNIANLLLVAAIDIAGLAVAFPVGIGLALVVGAISTYIISPKGNPLLLFAASRLWWRPSYSMP